MQNLCHRACWCHTLAISLHWLPVTACVNFKALLLACRGVRGTAPPYLQSILKMSTHTRELSVRNLQSDWLSCVYVAVQSHDACLYWPHCGGTNFPTSGQDSRIVGYLSMRAEGPLLQTASWFPYHTHPLTLSPFVIILFMIFCIVLGFLWFYVSLFRAC